MRKTGYYWLALLACCCLLWSCREESGWDESAYGYVQFHIVKTGTRATSAPLENLAQATKVRVVLQKDGLSVSQTLPLRRYNQENAEFGLQSDKLSLLQGRYTLIGFYLYDRMDEEIYANTGQGETLEVEAEGLCYHTLEVDALLRGMATFRLCKQIITKAGESGAYPFANIQGVSFTVKNQLTGQTFNIDKVKVSLRSVVERDAQEAPYETSYGQCDTVVWLPVGDYAVSGYTTYSDKKCRYALEARSLSEAPVFHIEANETTKDAPVPVVMETTSERMKDYVALKALWEALDGPNWSYHGEAATPGCNWNFNKDMDLWGDQPGVSLDNDGRVSTLSLIGMGAQGVVPDAIGQFTQLRTLYLGAHDETLGGVTDDISVYTSATGRERSLGYERLFLSRDSREDFAEPLRDFINRDSRQRPIRPSSRIELKDVQQGYLTNQITGISRALMRCTGLQQFYIANSPITTEGFFRDIDPASPFYGEDLKWENCDNLTDVEIYNCPKLTGLPMEMLAHLPEMQLLNVASNIGIGGAQLKADWESLIDGVGGSKIQIIYMGFNRLEETPSHEQLKRMTSLSALDLGHNQLHTVHPFGKGVNLVKLYLNNNRLTDIPAAADGYFSDFLDVEILNFAYNRLTEVPDIFNAKSVYTIDDVDFSHNQITSLQHGSAFRGINASTVNLSYNPFDTFPKELFSAGSPISYLLLSGTKLREIPEGSMKGPKSHYLMSIDLSLNSLSKLPKDFYATNFPYLYGVDLSCNQFESIPVEPLDCAQLTVLILRNQRDDQGNRTLKYWLNGIYNHASLTALYLGGNDLRKIDDTISPNIRVFEIKDNPNISIDLSGVCPYITAGYYQLYYDKTQDIRGCPALGIEN